ncbi:MAG TPA: hypothetical protein VMS17_00145 [Gemmataceae bacterium]|nr:hypothetical protein [Gemmataceae bacterium]
MSSKGKTSVSANGAASPNRIDFQGELSPTAARALLKFGFSERDHARMEDLSAKARRGALTPPEQFELDVFERLGCVLDIIHSKARQALKKKSQRAS